MIEYSPGQRYAWLAKSGAGKTLAITTLACRLVPHRPKDSDWQCWWLDTKDDRADLARLRTWGFSVAGTKGARPSARTIFPLRGGKEAVYEKAQVICRKALDTHGVLIVFDEYNHVCKNRIDAGPAVEDVHKRGRGLDVGSIGGVQEPVLCPRFLFSQANHLAIGALTHKRDIDIARELCPRYAPGWPKTTEDTIEDAHGFWLKSLDDHGDDGRWRYFRHIRAFDETLTLAERSPDDADEPATAVTIPS